MDAENLSPTWIRSPDRAARSESLYRLSYPGPLLRVHMVIYTLIYTEYMYNTALYTYINACTYGVYVPTQEAALPTVFMACHSVAAILNYLSSISRHSKLRGQEIGPPHDITPFELFLWPYFNALPALQRRQQIRLVSSKRSQRPRFP
jgi:hypothetical protein